MAEESKGVVKTFTDGIVNFVHSLIARRDVTAQNMYVGRRLTDSEMREVYRTGLGNKIVRLKVGYALKNTLQFASTEDEQFYNKRLARHVKQAALWMLAMGRGLIVLQHRGDDLSKPLTDVNANQVMLTVFSGDMVTVSDYDRDLQSSNYLKPVLYNVRGTPIHYSRCVDFTYIKPPELEAPEYRFGGISEFELIYQQLLADGIVQRASPRIIEKASTLFYKIKGFKSAMQMGKEADMVSYFGRLEDVRGIYAAGLIDADDSLEVVNQSISDLGTADQITLRRLAMVTSIPLALLVGENVKGLNSTGDNERQAFQDAEEALQSDYLIEPINDLMRKLGQNDASFKENQGDTPNSRIEYETKAIDNAVKLQQLGEDYRAYLEDKGIVKADDFDAMFGGDDDGDATA